MAKKIAIVNIYSTMSIYLTCLFEYTVNILFTSNRWSSGLQLPARVSSLYQKETRSSEVAESLSWNPKTHHITLKQKLLEESEVPHAFTTCSKTPDYCLNQVEELIFILKFNRWDPTKMFCLFHQDLLFPRDRSPELCDTGIVENKQDYMPCSLTARIINPSQQSWF